MPLGLGLRLALGKGGGKSLAETLAVSVAASSDDANENTGDTTVTITDQHVRLQNGQIGAVRFPNVVVPQGAMIISASIQFTASNSNSGATDTTIEGEDADDAAAYQAVNEDISGRTTTTASVPWTTPEAWTTGERTSAQETPDLTTIVQEIVNRVGWSSGNAMAFQLTNTAGNSRFGAAFDHATLQESMLMVRFVA